MKRAFLLCLAVLVFLLSSLPVFASEEQDYSYKYGYLNHGASKDMTVEEYVDFLLQRHERFEGEILVQLDGDYTEQEILGFLSGNISYESAFITLVSGTDHSYRYIGLTVGEENIRETLIRLLKDAVPQIVNCWPEYADKPGSNDVIGDVNGDGQVNSKDYILLKRHVLGSYTIPEDLQTRGDVNGDGSINAKDYVRLKRIVLKTWTQGTDGTDADSMIAFPEEAPAYAFAFESEPSEPDYNIIWVQNVNGRYVGLLRSMMDEVQDKDLYCYHFSFPTPTSLCIYDSATGVSLFVGLDHYCHSSTGEKEPVPDDNWEPYLSEKEAEFLFDNLPGYYERIHINVAAYTNPKYYYIQ